MIEFHVEERLRQVPKLEQYGETVSESIHQAVLDGGAPTRTVADILHGIWLGHPLHAVLTDVVIGAWTLGSLLDLIGIGTGSQAGEKAADRLMEVGVAAAIPTALAGVTDFSTIVPRAVTTASTHGLLNTLALGLFSLSVANRRAGNRGAGMFFSAMGLGILTTSAWLGGELVYKYRIMVNKNPVAKAPDNWQAVMKQEDLPEGAPKTIDVEGIPVLLYRRGGEVFAIGEVCGHEGGPLEEGTIEDHCVTCPWHQSVFDMRDGRVIHGPSTYPQPSYQTRLHNGQIELRVRKA